jgi:hypothetical protein
LRSSVAPNGDRQRRHQPRGSGHCRRCDPRSPRRATARLREQWKQPTARSSMCAHRVTELVNTDIQLRCDSRVACASGSEAVVREEHTSNRRPYRGHHASSKYAMAIGRPMSRRWRFTSPGTASRQRPCWHGGCGPDGGGWVSSSMPPAARHAYETRRPPEQQRDTPDAPSERASNERQDTSQSVIYVCQDIARNTHSAHHAHPPKLQVSGPFRQAPESRRTPRDASSERRHMVRSGEYAARVGGLTAP